MERKSKTRFEEYLEMEKKLKSFLLNFVALYMVVASGKCSSPGAKAFCALIYGIGPLKE
ncbi:unnamed protein product [Dovyalis caffra]|uniref:Uncharacterized protein n=1 Tax=Dovyalis caffra TaxID=77055 RepID=A0AAV1RP57_9ROSI|nr:unnamed protein product [Dovyalis caffra]